MHFLFNVHGSGRKTCSALNARSARLVVVCRVLPLVAFALAYLHKGSSCQVVQAPSTVAGCARLRLSH